MSKSIDADDLAMVTGALERIAGMGNVADALHGIASGLEQVAAAIVSHSQLLDHSLNDLGTAISRAAAKIANPDEY